MRKLRALRALSWRQRGQLLRAWWLLLAVDLLLRLLPLPRVESLLARRTPPPAPGTGDHRAADDLARLVAVAARHHVYPMLCLRQALVLKRLLARRGVASVLRIGVRREAGELKAHAWVELGGRPLGEPPEVADRFLPLEAAGGR